MSETATRIGEFEVDPNSIPEQPKFPLGQDVQFEIKKAERKEKIDEETGAKNVRISVQVAAVDYPGSPLAFGTLWVTERFRGKPHRSYVGFLQKLELPYTTGVNDLAGVRFVGQASERKGSDFLDLSAVSSKI